jgi:Rrf2 family protein
MTFTQKSKYALRAMLELAVRFGQGPTSIAEIAKTQAIPARFLEAILAQLKRASLVESRRGNEGGYVLARAPQQISVGDVLRSVQSSMAAQTNNRPVNGASQAAETVFNPLWNAALQQTNAVYDATDFMVLVERYRTLLSHGSADYSI